MITSEGVSPEESNQEEKNGASTESSETGPVSSGPEVIEGGLDEFRAHLEQIYQANRSSFNEVANLTPGQGGFDPQYLKPEHHEMWNKLLSGEWGVAEFKGFQNSENTRLESGVSDPSENKTVKVLFDYVANRPHLFFQAAYRGD